MRVAFKEASEVSAAASVSRELCTKQLLLQAMASCVTLAVNKAAPDASDDPIVELAAKIPTLPVKRVAFIAAQIFEAIRPHGCRRQGLLL